MKTTPFLFTRPSLRSANIALILTLLALSANARAEGEGAALVQYLDRDTAYVFQDDPLAGQSQGPASERIRVRPRGQRAMLIRPRVHFVKEIFKSAEAL